MKLTEVSILAGKQWNKMSDAEKKPYIDKNLEDKARQER